MSHCCETMSKQIEHQCDKHPDEFDCPDHLVSYSERFDEYGLIVHDGGSSCIAIKFCPWCGTKLPESKRDRWFDELEALGYENPFTEDIPSKYKTGEWYLA